MPVLSSSPAAAYGAPPAFLAKPPSSASVPMQDIDPAGSLLDELNERYMKGYTSEYGWYDPDVMKEANKIIAELQTAFGMSDKQILEAREGRGGT
jgi:hypothetical protein